MIELEEIKSLLDSLAANVEIHKRDLEALLKALPEKQEDH